MECFGLLYAIFLSIIISIISWAVLPKNVSSILMPVVSIGLFAVVIDYYFGVALLGRHFICSDY